MKNFRRMMAMITILTIVMTTVSFAGMSSVSAADNPLVELDYDDYYYGILSDPVEDDPSTNDVDETANGTCYIMSFKESAGVKASSKSADWYPYSIDIPDTVTLATADLSAYETLTGRTDVNEYSAGGATYDVVDIGTGAFCLTWGVPSLSTGATQVAGDKFTAVDTNTLYVKAFTGGENLKAISKTTQYFTYGSNTDKNLKYMFEYATGPAELVIPENVTSVGNLVKDTGGPSHAKASDRLTKVVLPDGLTNGKTGDMFNNCQSVKSIHCNLQTIYYNSWANLVNCEEMHFKSGLPVISNGSQAAGTKTWAKIFNSMRLNGSASYTGWWSRPVKIYVPTKALKDAIITAADEEYTIWYTPEEPGVDPAPEKTTMFQTLWGPNDATANTQYTILFNKNNVLVEGYTLYSDDMYDESEPQQKYRLVYDVVDAGDNFEAVLTGFDLSGDYGLPVDITLEVPATIADTVSNVTTNVTGIDNKAFMASKYYSVENAEAYPNACKSANEIHTIETLNIAEGIKKIGDEAFAGNKGLIYVTIPASVTSIGNACFKGDIFLYDVDIKAGTETLDIGSEVFYDCQRLRGLTLHDNASMAFGALGATKSLNYIIIDGTPEFKSSSGGTKFTLGNPSNVTQDIADDESTLADVTHVYMTQAAFDAYKEAGLATETTIFGEYGVPVVIEDGSAAMFLSTPRIENEWQIEFNLVALSDTPVSGNLLVGEYSDEKVLQSIKANEAVALDKADVKTFNIGTKFKLKNKNFKSMLFADITDFVPITANIDYLVK